MGNSAGQNKVDRDFVPATTMLPFTGRIFAERKKPGLSAGLPTKRPTNPSAIEIRS
jgi:hypothetical protein